MEFEKYVQSMEGKQINDLIVEDLNVLLGWHEVALALLKNKASKVAQLKAIASSKKVANYCC